MADQLAQFLNHLAANPVLRTRFLKNKTAHIDNAKLSAKEKHWLQTSDIDEIEYALEASLAKLAAKKPSPPKKKSPSKSPQQDVPKRKRSPQIDVPQQDVPKRKRSPQIDVPQQDVPKRKRSPQIDVPQQDVPKRKTIKKAPAKKK